MLFKLLDQVVSHINALDYKKEAPLLLKELKRVSPGYWKSLRSNMKKKGTKEEVIRVVEQAIAAGILSKVKEIPKIVEMMVSIINNEQTNPALRCALVGSLALLVKPRDLIPDDAPGGYGFLDDAILLRSALIKYLNFLPPGVTSLEKEIVILQFLSIGVPPRVLSALQTTIIGMQYGAMLLPQLPPFLLDTTTQMLVQNPMLAEIQAPPPGAQMGDTFQLPSEGQLTKTMAGTIYTEGGNIGMNFPNGESIFLSESGDILITD